MSARIDAKTLLIAAVVAAFLALAGAGGIAYATGGDDDSSSRATGPGIEKAKGTALDQTNGGRVTDTEVQDEEGYYEIEVTREDGSQMDVHLDRNFNVLDSSADHENPSDSDGPNGD